MIDVQQLQVVDFFMFMLFWLKGKGIWFIQVRK